jgi:hypothetical protein
MFWMSALVVPDIVFAKRLPDRGVTVNVSPCRATSISLLIVIDTLPLGPLIVIS